MIVQNVLIFIASLRNGYDFAVEVLSMWLHEQKKSKDSADKEIALCGQKLIKKFVFERTDREVAIA